MSRNAFFAVSAALLATGPGCTAIKQTLAMEGRIFVKIPGDAGRPEFASSPDGRWHFKHLVKGPKFKQFAGDWYMAWTDTPGGSTLKVSLLGTGGWKKVRDLVPEIAQEAHFTFGAWPVVIEPNAVFKQRSIPLLAPLKEGTGELTVGSGPSGAWAMPKREGRSIPAWHQGQDYSQLTRAKERVRWKTGSAGGGVTVAIMDNGYDGRLREGLPRNLVRLPAADAFEALQCTQSCFPSEPGQYGSEHGTATLSVLAGGHVRIKGTRTSEPFDGDLGGAPDATVIPYRVAPWVASVSTANLAYAIDHASRVRKADVISMSHGGSPSLMWIDAVNAAHARGTAIIAATGDYVNLPGFTAGIGAPSATVYPAACRRVLGVGGVAANRRSYGQTDFSQNWLGAGSTTRASYGPDGTAWMWNRQERMDKADPPQAKYLGALHPYPLCGWAPNITALMPAGKDGTGAGRVKLGFGGTSAATPQVGAAAALWLAYHKTELDRAGYWRSWQKPQMVYHALVHSAERDPARPWPDLFFGCGFLRASDALDESPAKVMKLKGADLKWPDKTGASDYYDGDRGLFRILKFNVPDFVRYSRRVDLRPRNESRPPQNLRDCLYTVHFNLQLSRYWQKGTVPVSTQAKPEPGIRIPSRPVGKLRSRLFGYHAVKEETIRAEAERRTSEDLARPPLPLQIH